MTDAEALDRALEPVAGNRATVRCQAGRASIILDVTGLDEAARAALEADVDRAARAVPGIDESNVRRSELPMV